MAEPTLEQAHAHGGAHPQDAMGAQMAAMAQTLEDTTAMKNVIAYVRTLAR